jgi:ketosteroid isomerase-like protein
MLRIVLAASLFGLSLVHNGDAYVASSQPGDVAKELTQIEQKLVKAWLAADRKTVESILADDWSVIDLTGHVLTRSQVLGELGSGERRIESGSVDELNVRTFGNFAIVTGRSVLAGSYQGNRVSVVQRFTDVFAKREGRWQVIASQGTQVAQPKPQ